MLALLVLGVLLVVLLLLHRSEGDLKRATFEYAVVGLFALLLAATPTTSRATTTVTAGVAGGAAAFGQIVARAWDAAWTQFTGADQSPSDTTRTDQRTTGDRPGAGR